MQIISIDDDYQAWREAALQALASRMAPEDIDWRVIADDDRAATPALFDNRARVPRAAVAPAKVRISRELGELLKDAACYRDTARWAFLYRVL